MEDGGGGGPVTEKTGLEMSPRTVGGDYQSTHC
jgi:hypothetical protein